MQVVTTFSVLLSLITYYVLFLYIQIKHVEAVKTVDPKFKQSNKDITLPPCASCKILIDSFKKGFERTKRSKYEGGDSAWEEDKLGSYSKSEVRLIEIQEGLCNEVQNSQAQCHALAEELESKIEDWWFRHQDTHPEIFDYICIEHAKRCCPKNHFGPECKACPGYPDKICNNNGKCKGDGTRKGNGGCLCDKGYKGEQCSECAPGHYESYRDENKLLCSPCPVACNSTCKGPGTRDCDNCANGWREITDKDGKGCFDINECENSEAICPGNEFCVNTEGSFYCIACDKACDGCTGDGPDMCTKCANDYTLKDNICVHIDSISKKKAENMARYTTYFGLGVATCIIFQRNIYVAGLIGVIVSMYIVVSEYIVYHNSVPDLGPNLQMLKPK